MTTLPSPPTEKSRLHPLVAIAAISVTAFSLFGIAAINGWLPSGKATSDVQASTPSATAVAPKDEQKVANAPEADKVFVAQKAAPSAPAAPSTPSAPKPAAKSAPKPMSQTAVKPALPELAQAPREPAPTPPATTSPAPPPCVNCGVIEEIREVTQPGEASGIGAIAGGVIGGLLGHQIGRGTGKDLATIAGAAGGAYAGHQIEKTQRKSTRYEISVRMNDGSLRTLTMDAVTGWRIGERVRIENGMLVRD